MEHPGDFDERGEYACRLLEPGTYSLTFFVLVRTPEGELEQRDLEVAREQLVEVRDDASTEQVFVVDGPE